MFFYVDKYYLQGDPLERRKSRRLLHNLKMCFLGCLSAHIDHKYWTFDYLNQGYNIFHFKIQLVTLCTSGNLAELFILG